MLAKRECQLTLILTDTPPSRASPLPQVLRLLHKEITMNAIVESTSKSPAKMEVGTKLRGADKVARIPVKIIPTDEFPRKPDWIRVRMPISPEVDRIKQLLRKHKLHSVCEEASCPNLGECFSGGTATFMIMGDICTRRCPFCDVGHGRPRPLDANEPMNLAVAIAELRLKLSLIHI